MDYLTIRYKMRVLVGSSCDNVGLRYLFSNISGRYQNVKKGRLH